VVKYVEEVVAIAEQTASGTQQVASTAKQLSGSMQELTSSSQNLNDIAADLQVSISAFKLIDGNLVFNERKALMASIPSNNQRKQRNQTGNKRVATDSPRKINDTMRLGDGKKN
jgi:glucose/arabinose dehydrogenase